MYYSIIVSILYECSLHKMFSLLYRPMNILVLIRTSMFIFSATYYTQIHCLKVVLLCVCFEVITHIIFSQWADTSYAVLITNKQNSSTKYLSAKTSWISKCSLTMLNALRETSSYINISAVYRSPRVDTINFKFELKWHWSFFFFSNFLGLATRMQGQRIQLHSHIPNQKVS